MKEAQKIIEDTIKDIENVQSQIDEINKRNAKFWESALYLFLIIALLGLVFFAWHSAPKPELPPDNEYVDPD
jgi:hypothetical protein